MKCEYKYKITFLLFLILFIKKIEILFQNKYLLDTSNKIIQLFNSIKNKPL